MLLTIYIPTYNRATILKRLLSIISSMLHSNPSVKNLIEIIISDNCSTDHTELIAKEFFDTYYEDVVTKYHKNPNNIGALANFIQAPQLCNGKFIWIVGDDDIPLPHVFPQIINSLQLHPAKLVFLNSTQDSHFSGTDCEILSREEIFEKCPITSLGHISRLILEKGYFESLRSELEKIPSYYIWPLALPFAMLKNDHQVLIVKDPAIYATKDGGMGIWKFKTPLARLAEFADYCKLATSDRAKLSTLYRLNFVSTNFVVKKYLAASIIFPGENVAFHNLRDVLLEFNVTAHPYVILGNFLRTRAGKPLLIIIRKLLKI